MRCLQCNREFEPKRSTARYCSAKCRKLAFQNGKDKNANGTLKTVHPADAGLTCNTFETPEGKVLITKLPANYGLPNCQCLHCQQNNRQKQPIVINHGAYKKQGQLAKNEVNRVSLPGDTDYGGVCLQAKYNSRRKIG